MSTCPRPGGDNEMISPFVPANPESAAVPEIGNRVHAGRTAAKLPFGLRRAKQGSAMTLSSTFSTPSHSYIMCRYFETRPLP